jgi:hypothetical protein
VRTARSHQPGQRQPPPVPSAPSLHTLAAYCAVLTSATSARTVDSQTCAPCSSTSRVHTRCAVCRCLRGTRPFRSSSSHPRIVDFHGPNGGDSHSGLPRRRHRRRDRLPHRAPMHPMLLGQHPDRRALAMVLPHLLEQLHRRHPSHLLQRSWRSRSVGIGGRGWGQFKLSYPSTPHTDRISPSSSRFMWRSCGRGGVRQRQPCSSQVTPAQWCPSRDRDASRGS